MTADQIIARLGLAPHPEGGHYRQTWIADNTGRAHGTCIYFLLRAGEASHWHKIDATEIWHFHSGAPLILSMSATGKGPATDHLLSPDLDRGAPQIIVPPATGRRRAAPAIIRWSVARCRPASPFPALTWRRRDSISPAAETSTAAGHGAQDRKRAPT